MCIETRLILKGAQLFGTMSNKLDIVHSQLLDIARPKLTAACNFGLGAAYIIGKFRVHKLSSIDEIDALHDTE